MNEIDDVLASRFDSLYHWLNSKYGLNEIVYKMCDREFRIFKVNDIELALEESLRDAGNPGNRSPYWTEFWPSAKALSATLLRSNTSFSNKAILEIGCGLGFTGISLGQEGGRVTLSDREPDALKLAELNWIVNNGNIAPSIRLLDWNQLLGCSPKADQRYDIILAADVAYEIEVFPILINALGSLLRPGGDIWLSEPNRPIANGFFLQLKEKGFTIAEQPQIADFPNISVYHIKLGSL